MRTKSILGVTNVLLFYYADYYRAN